MTLGCGAVAGNITSDNVGPQHLINIKRLAYAVRRAEDAFTVSVEESAAAAIGPIDRSTVTAAVERYLSSRGVGQAAKPVEEKPAVPTASVIPNVAAQVVDRFLSRRGIAPNPGPPTAPPATSGVKSESNPTCHVCSAAPEPAAPAAEQPAAQPVPIADFVCEDDVRAAMKQSRKIYIGPKTIVTPSARDLAGDILVLAQR
jgi:acetaldehyde dehydrogenase (acetylating)